jgi:dolichyl-phosphate-mannose--protein O-mannosyl transferase
VIRKGDLEIRLLWRNKADNYWPMELSTAEPIGNFTSPSKELVIVKAGYLVRTAHVNKRQTLANSQKVSNIGPQVSYSFQRHSESQ